VARVARKASATRQGSTRQRDQQGRAVAV